VILRLEYARSPEGQAERATDTFRRRAAEWAERLLTDEVSFSVAFAEGSVGTLLGVEGALFAEEAPWEANQYSLDLNAFGATEAAYLHVFRVEYDAQTATFQALSGDVLPACCLEPLTLPGDDWLANFVMGPRCPACRILPDMTAEYLPCELCDYADYRDDSPSSARERFLSQPHGEALAEGVKAMLRSASTEPDPARRLYVRYRLMHLQSYIEPSLPGGLKPLPWEES
jgi:hypothetical protein